MIQGKMDAKRHLQKKWESHCTCNSYNVVPIFSAAVFIMTRVLYWSVRTFGLGAKSHILSSVAPPRKKKLVTIFSQGQVWGPQKPMFY